MPERFLRTSGPCPFRFGIIGTLRGPLIALVVITDRGSPTRIICARLANKHGVQVHEGRFLRHLLGARCRNDRGTDRGEYPFWPGQSTADGLAGSLGRASQGHSGETPLKKSSMPSGGRSSRPPLPVLMLILSAITSPGAKVISSAWKLRPGAAWRPSWREGHPGLRENSVAWRCLLIPSLEEATR